MPHSSFFSSLPAPHDATAADLESVADFSSFATPATPTGADAVIDRSLERPGSSTVDKHGAYHAVFVNVKARREKTHCSLTSKIQITILRKSHANGTIF